VCMRCLYFETQCIDDNTEPDRPGILWEVRADCQVIESAGKSRCPSVRLDISLNIVEGCHFPRFVLSAT